MYKKQMKLQKLACFFVLAVAVVLFLYALGIMTDLYDSLYTTLRITVEEDPNAPGELVINATERRGLSGTIVYRDMQDFNKTLLSYSIAYLIIVVLLFVTNTSTRRRFYITNYISIVAVTVASIYIPIYAHSWIEYFKARFLQIDFEALKTYSETYGTKYTESTLWFDLHYFVFALMFLAAVAIVGICVWKVMLMKEERKLVEEGKKVKA